MRGASLLCPWVLLTAVVLGSDRTGAQVAGPTMIVVQDLAWSADGRTLFFSAMRVKPDYSDYAPDKWGVYAYDVEGAEVRLVAAAAFSVSAAPSGGRIVVGKLIDGNRDLVVLDDSGATVARLTTHPADDFAAAWSPDGRRIAFNSKRNGHSELFIAAADGSDPRRLLDTGTDRALHPAWSHDGRLIAYYREKGDGQDQIHVVRADGTGDRNLTNDAFNNIYPGWRPDGSIVYGRGRKGQPTKAFTVRLDGSEKRPLAAIEAFFVRYAPDGRRLAWLEEDPDGQGVRAVIGDPQGRVIATIPLQRVGSPF